MNWIFWKKKHEHFHIDTNKYGAIVDFLDGLRDDQRKGAIHENARPIPDEFVLLYCERKGYVKYLFTGGNFVRTLSKEGHKILSFMNYEDYRKWKSTENAKTWYPIRIAFVALLVAIFAATVNTCNAKREKGEEQIKNQLKQLDSSIKSLKDSLTFYRQTSIKCTSNINDEKKNAITDTTLSNTNKP